MQSLRRAAIAIVLLGGALLPALAAQPGASRPAIDLKAEYLGCPGVRGRYVVLLEPGRGGVVLSGGEFPGAQRVGAAAGGRFQGAVSGYGTVDVALAPDGEIWALPDRTLDAGLSGCLAFDKDQFTWQSDLLTYVRYLADELLVPANRWDPAITSLAVGTRTVRLEVTRPGRDTAVLEGVEGGMLGYGATTDPVRYFVLPTVLGGAAPPVLARILINRGTAFEAGATTELATALVPADGTPVTTASDPVFTLRLLAIEP
ncbi:MAG: hypothetical protein R2991_14015 [Thermoanaerobaculia bacterium]